MKVHARWMVALVAGSLVFALPPAHVAAGDVEVRRSGACSSGSEWKLKLSPENGGIEVEFEVDQNVVGDRWRVTLKRDGTRFFRGIRETKGPSGSFEVRRDISDGAGTDHVVGRARNLSTDEICRGAASI